MPTLAATRPPSETALRCRRRPLSASLSVLGCLCPSSTHPHLLQPGELTPFVSADEYHQRRKRLVDSLEDGAIVVIAGGQIQYMTQNIL